MPTTRSQGRHEPLQSLQTPPKRIRKSYPKKSRLIPERTQDMIMRTLSMSPEPHKPLPKETEVANIPVLASVPVPVSVPAVSYVDASTQTEEVIVLTKAQAAELRDRSNATTSHKRNRGDEPEEEPVAKRHHFSTPQNNKPNNLWMFGERANGEHPRTAPSKSLSGSALRRPMRGSLSKRSNLVDSPRFRVRNHAVSDKTVTFDRIKPIQQEVEDGNTSEAADQPQESSIDMQGQQESQQRTNAPQTPRRGLFGSLRGMVHKGWDLAASLTPRSGRAEPPQASQNATQDDQISYPQIDSSAEDETAPSDNQSEQIDSRWSHSAARVSRPQPDHEQPSSEYDHLHYIPADTESVNRAISGEIEPPPGPPTPPSPMSRVRSSNPGLPDATIESMLKKKERKAALDEERYGPRPLPQPTTVAPLFGPDSHYARGTVDPRFLPPTPLYGPSKKRKLESVNGKIPRPKHGGFGIDDEYLDVDAEVDSVDQPEASEQMEAEAEIPPAKRHRTQDSTTTAPATPRSALKKPGFTGSVGRKSVAFGTSMSRDIRGHYGPAGQYKGSTFADELSDDAGSPSSIDHTDVISPTTRLNTFTNSGRKPPSVLGNIGANIPAIDFTMRDPNDSAWRPSLGNPRPGVFRVPDVDEEDPDESMTDDTPEQPQTPRMSHAELPAAPSPFTSSSFNEGSIVHESTELALDKARSKAEKYKPKSSSRLSEVSRARSRSASPDEEDEDQAVDPTATGTSSVPTPTVQPVGVAPRPFVPRELDNTTEGADGMTDYQREHQYDEWAANLQWDAPQTYEDAGTGSAFIHNLIRKNWTEEDGRRSEAFWAREFDEVDRAMEEAKGKGQKLILITGMEEIEGY